MHRTDLQRLASARLREARALRAAGEWSGAYYLTGYAVELGLKSCLVKQFKKNALPDLRIVRQAYTHNLDELVAVAGLKANLNARTKSDADFEVNWSTCKDWSEAARYASWSKSEAEDLYTAVVTRRHGVLPWIKEYW